MELFGKLKYDTDNGAGGARANDTDESENDVILNEDRIYYSICLEEVKRNISNSAATGLSHISKVKNFALHTSSRNLNAHLRSTHSINTTVSDSKMNKNC